MAHKATKSHRLVIAMNPRKPTTTKRAILATIWILGFISSQ